MLRKGYVLLRRVFLFKHFTPIPRPKWPGGAGALTHPLLSPLPSFRPPRAPAPSPTPELPEAARRGRCPCNPSGLPGGAAGRSGDHRRRSQTLARAADWEVSPEGGRRRGAGDPGERGSQALNPPEGFRSKTLARRQRQCGWGLGGWLWPQPTPQSCGLGLPGPGPWAASPGGGGSAYGVGSAGPLESRPSAGICLQKPPPPQGLRKGCVSLPHPPPHPRHPREQNSRIPAT